MWVVDVKSLKFRVRLHSSGYYLAVCDPAKNRTWSGKDRRAFQELPYHLVR